MKKLLYSFFIFAGMAMIFSSCSTQLPTVSIAKRHYKNGYYVSVNNNKHTSDATSEVTKNVIAEPASVAPVTSTANNVSETSPVEENTSGNTFTAPKNKQNISKELTASAVKHAAPGNLKRTITPNTVKELKNIQAASKLMVSENKNHSNNNNSLIWTIIVILLLLWLLSVLMGGWGLGGILHLLLVIALILLILHLLGII